MTSEIHDDPLSANDGLRLASQRYYDRASGDELVTTLVSSIADVLDVDPFDSTRMPPLFYYLDPELLESVLFESTPTEIGYDPDKTMIFDYVGLTVAVRNNGWVFVYEPTDRNN
ncbi:HalOD1 output domain-containing protein [Salinirubrum litoreum]|uniref:HalOD1 output domain-containing protein n=1 Tax=Salinirubrum litoreum TaxID=1126234 RepID=A0ABD5RDV1_9EURY|nr:HalOD1 output domain-containing protein [Salinirubrum litoreum]